MFDEDDDDWSSFAKEEDNQDRVIFHFLDKPIKIFICAVMAAQIVVLLNKIFRQSNGKWNVFSKSSKLLDLVKPNITNWS